MNRYLALQKIAGNGGFTKAAKLLRRADFDIVCLPAEPPLYRTLAIGDKGRGSLPIAGKYFIEYLLQHKEQQAY